MTTDEPRSLGAEGAADGSRRLTLHFLAGSRKGSSVTLEEGTVRLGRGPEMDVRFDPHVDVSVSGRHASLAFRNGGWWIEDDGASNGTLVNRQPFEAPLRLRSGDVVDLGRQADQQGEGYVTFGVVEGRADPVDPDLFEALVFPCPSCRGSLAATRHQSGVEVVCGRCGKTTRAPESVLEPDVRDAAAPPTGPLGVWDGLKRRFAGFRESRRISAELDQVVSEVDAARRSADHTAAAFARRLWEAAHAEVTTLPAARALAQWNREQSGLLSEIGELVARRDAIDRKLEELRTAWEETARPLRDTVEKAHAEETQRKGRLSKARAEVTSSFADTLAPAGARATELARVIEKHRDDPGENVCDELALLVDEMQSACDGLGRSWDRLRSLLAMRTEREAEAEAAGAALREARETLDRAQLVTDAEEAAVAGERAGVEKQVRDARASVEALNDRFRHELRDLGREAVTHDLAEARAHPDYEETCESLKSLRTLEARVADLQAELNRLRDSGR